jgi:SNF2 family DNA or RNA helicase
MKLDVVTRNGVDYLTIHDPTPLALTIVRGATSGLRLDIRTQEWSAKLDFWTVFDIEQHHDHVGIEWGIRGKQWWDAQRTRVDRLKAIRGMPYANWHANFDPKLDPHQRAGVAFLIEAERCILADEPGVGKTAQAIVACKHVLWGNTTPRRVLAVVPNAVKWFWYEQFQEWAPEYQAFVLNGDKAQRERTIVKFYQEDTRPKVLITHYEGLRLHWRDLKPFDILIADEAHRIKERSSQQTKATKAIHSRYLWLLTGTPIRNRVDELWSLLNAIDPKRWSGYWAFVDNFCDVYDTQWGKQIAGIKPDKRDELERQLSLYMLRRRARDVLPNLKTPRATSVPVTLSAEQLRTYHELKEEFFTRFENGLEMSTPWVIQMITRLRQICLNPALFGGTDVSPKTDALMSLLDDYREDGVKVVVFSQFRRYVEYVAARLEAKKVPYMLYTGTVSQTQRIANEKEFQESDKPYVLLGTIDAMGEGVNLWTGRVVIFTDRAWTPAANEQAWKRVVRRGQEGEVTIVDLTARNTIEGDILKMNYAKEKLSETVLTPQRLYELWKSETKVAA